jgi:hypothetical protein
LKLPAPPNRGASEQEIGVLKRLSFRRDAAALDLINFWDAGSPSQRWNDFTIQIRYERMKPCYTSVVVIVAQSCPYGAQVSSRRMRRSRQWQAHTEFTVARVD